MRALQPNEIAWDSAVPGFGARRQTDDTVAYVLKSRTAEGAAALAHDRPTRRALDAGNRARGSPAAAGRGGEAAMIRRPRSGPSGRP